ncbi:MAG: hypothetical protein EON54_02875 [Alcaligenaceae bacterium]|nr:MAG: hypothetical protein EON54_02875 [Alcaligenaceae bacterium]
MGALDHLKNKRSVRPKEIDGSIEEFAAAVDLNHNKWKYTSGVISFRDQENPTDEQKRIILKTFKAVYFAGLDPESIPHAFVEHRDKGNLEIHFLVSRMATDGKSFNMNPPGKKSFEITKAFQAVVNHKMNYAQIVENPFKAHLSKFEHQYPSQSQVRIKTSLADSLSKGIMQGKINNRSELINNLESVGIEITRKGQDYLSVKFPNTEKAVRLKGPMFDSKADYKALKILFANESKRLTEDQYSKNIVKLNELADERSAFNRERHKPRELKARTYLNKRQFNQSPDMASMDIKSNKPVEISNEFFDTLKTAPAKSEKSTHIETTKSNIQAVKSTFSSKDDNGPSSPTSASNSGNLESLESQVVELDNQAIGLNAKLNQAKTETEKSNIRQKLAELLHKKMMLNVKIQMEKIRAASKSSPNKPRGP